jgi:hypothetical protein
MKKLLLGIQSFGKLRQTGGLYVDKTAEILRLLNAGNALFFARPRWFGKSLLVSTLKEIFTDNWRR